MHKKSTARPSNGILDNYNKARLPRSASLSLKDPECFASGHNYEFA